MASDQDGKIPEVETIIDQWVKAAAGKGGNASAFGNRTRKLWRNVSKLPQHLPPAKDSAIGQVKEDKLEAIWASMTNRQPFASNNSVFILQVCDAISRVAKKQIAPSATIGQVHKVLATQLTDVQLDAVMQELGISTAFVRAVTHLRSVCRNDRVTIQEIEACQRKFLFC